MACLDTTALLDASSPRASTARTNARALISSLEERGEQLCTTRFNVAELYVGIERSRSPDREAARVADMLAGIEVLEFDDASASVFGALKAASLARGRPVGDLDVLIGAVAVAHGHLIVTRNAAHFADMTGLTVLAY